MLDKNKEQEQKYIRKKIHFWIFISTLLLIVSIVLALVICKLVSSFGDLGTTQSAVQSLDETKLTRRMIDGVYVEPGKENYYPLAIMTDNHINARPPAALSKANLVIEAEAEGGITRYLAIYASGEAINEIGPIRSARPYFIDWARELSALYIHVGGSPESLVKMTKENSLHINEFYNENYFWREASRRAPHNVLSSTASLNKYLLEKNLTSGKYFSWRYKDEGSLKNATHTNIKIYYQHQEYNASWLYDQVDNNYIRFLDNKKHTDANGEVIAAKNIVIQFVEAEEIDEELRQEMKIIGKGKAVVCLDGICQEGEWKKRNASSRTRFYNKDNEEAAFNAGTTWVEVVRPDYKVEY